MGEGWDPFNWFNTATFFFLSQIFFIFNDLRWEVIVRFVDIDGIVDNHCLSLLSFQVLIINVYLKEIEIEVR